MVRLNDSDKEQRVTRGSDNDKIMDTDKKDWMVTRATLITVILTVEVDTDNV